jgi:hypothetical protein
MSHALLSASGSKRWLSCPPSAQLEKQLPEQKSEYAEEGTFAHALAELKLGRAVANNIRPSVYKKKLAEMKNNPLYSTSMEEYIEQYATQVFERLMKARKNCSDALILLEQRLDFSEWVPEGFGTGDVVIIADNILEIIDLKYGKGVPVSAIDNPQTRLYGLGCIANYSMLYDFDTIRMTIIQPRLDSISTEEMTVDELLKWAEEYVKPRAALAIAGEGELAAGDHCQFCRAKFTCRKRAEANLEMAKYDFQDPFLLTVEEIAEILAKADELQKWAKDVQDYALDQASNHGVKFPGWKLVEGRSNRKYVDENAVIDKLKAEGYPEEVFYAPRKIWGITEMEKVLGKKLFEKHLRGLVIKPAGKPVLVPESDKRPELSSVASAQADFKEQI